MGPEEVRRVLTQCQASRLKTRVMRGTACVLEGLEGEEAFPLDVMDEVKG